MTKFTKEILKLLKSHSFKETEYIEVLTNVQNEINVILSEKVEIEETFFNILKDMIWYNFEKEKEYTLINWGKKYPHIQHCCDNDNVINVEELQPLYEELQDIKKKFENNVLLVQLAGAENLFTQDAYVYIPKQNEHKLNCIVCNVKDSLHSYAMEKIKIFTVINDLLTIIEKASKRNVKVEVNFIA